MTGDRLTGSLIGSLAGSLIGRTVLVTGASAGIGRAICQSLGAAGAEVIALGRAFPKKSSVDGVLEEVIIDLEDLDRLGGQLESLARRLPQVDAVVANAGFGRFGSLEEFSWSQIRSLVDVNLTAQIFIARAFLPSLKRHASSDLLLMGSESGVNAGRQGAVYSASKFAVRGLAQALRQECAKSGLRVSVVHPGMVRTSFFDSLPFEPGEEPANYLLPEDVAAAVLGILSSRPEVVYDEVRLSPLKKVVRKKPPSS